MVKLKPPKMITRKFNVKNLLAVYC